ncbi:MAG: hypothetical protein AABY00_03020 [Nanoarchaeota archaeon]
MSSIYRGEGVYLAQSQLIRQKLLLQTHLIQDLQRHIEHLFLEKIGEGSHNKIYRLGQLENGLWIAVREHADIRTKGFDEVIIKRHESYAQSADIIFQLGRRVSKFCIGVLRPDKYAAILVEDFSEGGKRKIMCSSDGDLSGWFTDTNEDVWIDLDDENPKNIQIEYMTPKNCILL